MQDKPLHPDIVEVQRFVNCLISEHMVNLFHPNGTKELARRLLSLADHGHS
jgi:sorbitol-specific phosphotransferase system component IIA